MPTFGSLFSGIGGIDLGLERAGWQCRWQVEINDYCRRVLAKHWPDVPRHGDIKQLRGNELEQVDLIAGGFPCQPVSQAGKRLAQADERWLWPEFARILRVVRPRFVFVENVPGLLVRGMGDVLGDLAALGFDAEWDCIPAAAFGAPHLRYRVIIVAYANDWRAEWWQQQPEILHDTGSVAYAKSLGAERLPVRQRRSLETQAHVARDGTAASNTQSKQVGPSRQPRLDCRVESMAASTWDAEPGVGQRADGVPATLDGGGGVDANADEETNGPGRVFPLMHGVSICQRCAITHGYLPLAIPKDAASSLRIMWGYEESACPSHRRERAEQLAQEHPDLMRELSHYPPPPCPLCWIDGSWENGISRLSSRVPNRRDRLAALGNAVVPQVAEWVGKRLMDAWRRSL